MNKQKKILNSIFIRYLLLIILALNGFALIYFILTPITIYIVYFIFGLFFNVSLSSSTIIIGNSSIIEIISACVAGSAYYLLFLLNLSIQDIKLKKRIKLLAFSVFSLLIINVLRIFLLGTLFHEEFFLFDILHKILWYLGSIIFVVLIWFWETARFNIKEIPFVKDLTFLYSLTKKK